MRYNIADTKAAFKFYSSSSSPQQEMLLLQFRQLAETIVTVSKNPEDAYLAMNKLRECFYYTFSSLVVPSRTHIG